VANKLSDIEYMKRSLWLRRNSHDPHRQVAAIIVGRNGNVLSERANEPPDALDLSRSESLAAIEDDPTWKYFILEHAERNAIYTAHAAGHVLRGTTMYATLYPCADCARAIVAAGISRLVILEPAQNPERDEKWLTHYRFAKKIFELGGVAVEFVQMREPTNNLLD
jgi:dCMP deaminase